MRCVTRLHCCEIAHFMVCSSHRCTIRQATKYSVRPRDVHFHIMKKDRDAEFWPRLLKDKALEKTNVKLDWDRYVDEDGEDAAGFDTDAMGPGAMVQISYHSYCNVFLACSVAHGFALLSVLSLFHVCEHAFDVFPLKCFGFFTCTSM